MSDKDLMENLLTNAKGVCDLFMHGSIESATPQVHEAFHASLNDALCMQENIYRQMESRGWYAVEQEQPQRLQQVKQKYAVPA